MLQLQSQPAIQSSARYYQRTKHSPFWCHQRTIYSQWYTSKMRCSVSEPKKPFTRSFVSLQCQSVVCVHDILQSSSLDASPHSQPNQLNLQNSFTSTCIPIVSCVPSGVSKSISSTILSSSVSVYQLQPLLHHVHWCMSLSIAKFPDRNQTGWHEQTNVCLNHACMSSEPNRMA